ncbi:autotransporter outer membrane beta-barrel domain-containing protein [Luteibacter sp. 9133]|uniref:autotransporter outer membrane beta-barrel domain-containing protein n=1 Tax=Luteibacter sp. 9133 TaxID=1500891 RepID=UPI0005BC4E9B|nr:autotransporter outer membrane beta-barrel domain-containing protein [Luteibacter sp. 9133]
MVVHCYRRRAVAAALCGVFAASASATEFPYGILVEKGTALTLEPGDRISVSGLATGRVITVESRGSFDATDVSIENRTSGNPAGYAYGVLAFDGSQASMSAGSLITRGDRSVGVQVQGASRAVFAGVQLTTLGANSIGITARSGAAILMNRAHLSIDGPDSTALVAQGTDAAVVGLADIEHRGAASAPGRAQAIAVRDGARIGLSDSSVIARHANVGAVVIDGEASGFSTSRSHIVAEGEHAWALSGTSGRAILTAAELNGNGGAITTRVPGAGTLQVDLLGGSRSVGDIVSGDASLVLNAEDSELRGDLHRAGTGSLDVTLARSRWLGRAQGVSALTIHDGHWSLTGGSVLGRLTLAGAARVSFPEGTGAFSTLRVSHLASQGGVAAIRLRTRLDAGGILSRQGTDRLLVDGDVDGTTRLEVAAVEGGGAGTAPGSSGGISLVQVNGSASDTSFRLAGDYVVAGPWRYGLNAYGPGESDASQRLVAENGSGFWDYRLQSTKIDSQGRWRDALGRTADPTSPAMPARDALAPQVPSYLVLAGALFGYGRTAIDAAGPDASANDGGSTFRARSFGGNASYRNSLGFTRFGFDSIRRDRGLQVGGDLASFDAGTWHMRSGMSASLGSTQVTPRAVDGASDARAQGRGLAITHTFSGDDGWRIGAAYAFTHYRVAVRTPRRGETLARLRVNSSDASLSAGFRWTAPRNVVIEPGISLLWQRLRFGKATDRDGIILQPGRPERMTARVGARATRLFPLQGQRVSAWSAFLDGRIEATRDTGAALALSGVRFATGHGGRALQVAAGTTLAFRRAITLSGDINRQVRIGGRGDSSFGVRLGAAIAF